MKRLVYVIGPPAAGKTTMMTSALRLLEVEGVTVDKPFAHVRYGKVWHLGRHRDLYGGTDTLSMSVSPVASEWLSGVPDDVVVTGEGDRLANKNFLAAAAVAGEVVLVHLDTPPLTVARRMAERPKPQSDTWLRGRLTKVANIVRDYDVVRFDGSSSLSERAAALRDLWT